MTRRSDTEITSVVVDYMEPSFTVMANATYSVSTTTTAFTNRLYRGLRLFFSGGAWTVSATASASFRVQTFDDLSARWSNIPGAFSTALNPTASSTFIVLTLYPGLVAVTSQDINHHIGYTWRVVVDVVATGATRDFIFSIAGQYIR